MSPDFLGNDPLGARSRVGALEGNNPLTPRLAQDTILALFHQGMVVHNFSQAVSRPARHARVDWRVRVDMESDG